MENFIVFAAAAAGTALVILPTAVALFVAISKVTKNTVDDRIAAAIEANVPAITAILSFISELKPKVEEKEEAEEPKLE